MSKLRADNITNRAADGAPTFTDGVSVTGFTTSTNVSVTTNVSVGSSVTAASFHGDGSKLSGVSAGLAATTVTLQTWLFGG